MAKQKIEQKQRDDAKQRKENNVKWQPKYFYEQGDSWVFVKPLSRRLAEAATCDNR